MNSKTKRILFFMSEINELYEKIKSKFIEYAAIKKDQSFLWEDSFSDIIKISSLINKILIKAGTNLAEYRRQYDSAILFFRASSGKQERVIREVGFDEWFAKLTLIMGTLPEAVLDNYIYLHENYDAFSEHSRDNEKKAGFIFSLAKPHFRLLEIGPGTGTLLRRLLKKGLDVNAIELEEKMISIILDKYPKAKGRVQQGDFLNVVLANESYDLIFIESGIFMFTELHSPTLLIFECFSNINERKIYEGFSKIYNVLRAGGYFLIGVQGLMEKVKITRNLNWYMRRQQFNGYTLREVRYTWKNSIFSKEKLLFSFRQQKPTWRFQNFVQLAENVGFRNIALSSDRLWIILRKI